MKKSRIAVLGCGWIGLGAESDLLRERPCTHVRAILDDDSFELVALQDISKESEINAIRFSIDVPFYDSAKKLLEEISLDAVTIASPPETHCELIELCLKHGIKNILCEKPLALDYKQAKDIMRKVKSANANLIVNHMRQFSPLINKVRDYIKNTYIRDTLTSNIISGVAFYDKGLHHCGTHIIDLLVYLLGPVKEVTAVHSSVFIVEEYDIAPEVILRFDTCQISLKPFDSREYSVTEIMLYGEKGSIKLKNMWGRKVVFTGIRNCLDYSAYRELDEDNTKVLYEEESFMTSTYNYFSGSIMDSSTYQFDNNILHVLEVMDVIEQSANQNSKSINLMRMSD